MNELANATQPQPQLAPAAERAAMLVKLQQAMQMQNQQAIGTLAPQAQLPPSPPLPPQLLLQGSMNGFPASPTKRDWTPIALLGGGLLAMVTILGSVAMISANSPAAVQDRQLAAMNQVAIEASRQRSICIAFVCPPTEPPTTGATTPGNLPSSAAMTAQPQPITPLPNPFYQQQQQFAPGPTPIDPKWAWMQQESNEAIAQRVASVRSNPSICSQNLGFCEALQQQQQQRGIS